MRNTLAFLICAMLFSHALMAQYSETIQTSRPGQAFVPFTTGKNTFQVQAGGNYTQLESRMSSKMSGFQSYGTTFRYGVLENLELRTGLTYSYNRILTSESGYADFSGLSLMSIGGRYNLAKGSGADPSFGVQGEVLLPFGTADFMNNPSGLRVMFIHSQQITELFQITTNLGASTVGKIENLETQYVINLAFPIGKKWGGFIENYGQIRGLLANNVDFDTRWDTGVGFLVNNDFQLDASVGVGLNEKIFDWFIDAGISWRIRFDQ